MDFQKTLQKIRKLSVFGKIILALVIFVIGYYLSCCIQTKNVIEKFSNKVYQKEKFVHKKNQNIFDPFYVEIYDKLEYNHGKNNFEVGQIVSSTKSSPSKSVILDIGCGHGHQVNLFTSNNYDIIGIDKSEAMIEYAKEKYPNSKFQVGDAMDSMLFPQGSFTHINALYFTIYYIKNKKHFFNNCYNWLRPGGYLTIHLVNRDKFDPVMEAANPLEMINIQKFAPKRITKSEVIFNDFDYKCDFKLDKEHNMGIFDETIQFKDNGHVRKQEFRTLYANSETHHKFS